MPSPAALPRPLRRPAERAVVLPSWTALALVAALSLAGLSLPASVRDPLLLALALLALHHRGLDPLLPGRATGRAGDRRLLAGTLAAYALLAALVALAWRALPDLVLLVVPPVLWFHFGQADRGALAALGHDGHLEGVGRPLAAFVRGGIPVVVPALAHPEAYRGVVFALVVPLDVGTVQFLLNLFGAPLRWLLGAWFLSVPLVALALGYRRAGATRSWRLDVGETLLLVAFFAAVPPALALAVYAAAWHALRAYPALLLSAPGGVPALRRGEWRAALRDLAVDGAPFALALAAVVAGGLLAVGGAAAPRPALYGRVLVLVAATTLPHAAVTAWTGRQN